MSLIFAFLFVCALAKEPTPVKIKVNDIPCLPNLTSGFNWNYSLIYTLYGIISDVQTYPNQSYIPPTKVTLIVNPLKGIIAFNSSMYGYQIVTPNGYFYIPPNSTTCLNNTNYN